MRTIDFYLALFCILLICFCCLGFSDYKTSEQTTFTSSSSGTLSEDCVCPQGQSFFENKCSNSQVACILLFDPVCGCDGITYSNSCFANGAGIKKFTKGECSSSGKTICINDEDCPKGVCPNGQTYQAFACLNNQCNQINFFADPCQFLSSSGSSIFPLNENFTGVWRGKNLRQEGSNKITLKLCVKNGALEGSVHQGGFINKGLITSQSIISENEVNLIISDKNNREESLTLRLNNETSLTGIFGTNEIFEAKKLAGFRRCLKSGCPNCDLVRCAHPGNPPPGCEIKKTILSNGCKSCCEEIVCSSSSSGGFENCSSRGSCRGESGEELPCPSGTECSGLPAYGCYPPGCPVPICLSHDTRIRTNGIQRKVADIKEGDIVLSDGEKPVKVIKTSMVEVKEHNILKVKLNDATVLEISPNHPTADGRLFKDLKMGDIVDKRMIVEVKSIPYKYKYTYDVLPDSKSGNYYANGVLIGSTLSKGN